MNWFLLAMGAMGCLSGMLLVFKHLSNRGVPAAVILVFTLGLAFLFNVAHLLHRGASFRIDGRALAWLVLAAGLSFAGNLLFLRSLGLASNPGYPAAVEGAKALAVALVSVAVFGARLSPAGVLGVVLCVTGLALLAR